MARRFCYVVLAHTDPPGLTRLVRRIRELSPAADVVVRFHGQGTFDVAALRRAGATCYPSRVQVRWGDWTQVEMVLGALAFARGRSDADHVVVMSGQDYPIRDLAAWEEEVRSFGVDALLDPLPPQAHNHTIRWSVRTLPQTDVGLVDRAIRFALNRAGAAARPVAYAHTSGRPDDDRVWLGVSRRLARPAPMTITKCAQWLTLRDRAVDELLDRDRRDARTRRYFEHVKIPDESYAASVLHDTPGLVVGHGETSAKEFLPGQGSPEWVDLAVLDRLRRGSAAPFARKFPVGVAPEVLAAADRLARRDPAAVWADVVEPGRPTEAALWPEHVRARVIGRVGPSVVPAV